VEQIIFKQPDSLEEEPKLKTLRIIALPVLISIGLALIAGCGSREAKVPAENATGPSPSATEAEAPTVPEASPAEEASAFAGSIDALHSLLSYSYVTVMTYDGIDNGAAKSETLRITGEYVAPDRHHITLIDSDSEECTEFILIGNALWVYDEGEWRKVPEVASAALMQSVVNFGLPYVWSGLASGFKDDLSSVGQETVNGIKAVHYTSDYTGWEENIEVELADAHADIWIAEEGYPVKFVFTASGKDEEGNEGTARWETEVTNVNGSIEIEPPAE